MQCFPFIINCLHSHRLRDSVPVQQRIRLSSNKGASSHIYLHFPPLPGYHMVIPVHWLLHLSQVLGSRQYLWGQKEDMLTSVRGGSSNRRKWRVFALRWICFLVKSCLRERKHILIKNHLPSTAMGGDQGSHQLQWDLVEWPSEERPVSWGAASPERMRPGKYLGLH